MFLLLIKQRNLVKPTMEPSQLYTDWTNKFTLYLFSLIGVHKNWERSDAHSHYWSCFNLKAYCKSVFLIFSMAVFKYDHLHFLNMHRAYLWFILQLC